MNFYKIIFIIMLLLCVHAQDMEDDNHNLPVISQPTDERTEEENTPDTKPVLASSVNEEKTPDTNLLDTEQPVIQPSTQPQDKSKTQKEQSSNKPSSGVDKNDKTTDIKVDDVDFEKELKKLKIETDKLKTSLEYLNTKIENYATEHNFKDDMQHNIHQPALNDNDKQEDREELKVVNQENINEKNDFIQNDYESENKVAADTKIHETDEFHPKTQTVSLQTNIVTKAEETTTELPSKLNDIKNEITHGKIGIGLAAIGLLGITGLALSNGKSSDQRDKPDIYTDHEPMVNRQLPNIYFDKKDVHIVNEVHYTSSLIVSSIIFVISIVVFIFSMYSLIKYKKNAITNEIILL